MIELTTMLIGEGIALAISRDERLGIPAMIVFETDGEKLETPLAALAFESQQAAIQMLTIVETIVENFDRIKDHKRNVH